MTKKPETSQTYGGKVKTDDKSYKTVLPKEFQSLHLAITKKKIDGLIEVFEKERLKEKPISYSRQTSETGCYCDSDLEYDYIKDKIEQFMAKVNHTDSSLFESYEIWKINVDGKILLKFSFVRAGNDELSVGISSGKVT